MKNIYIIVFSPYVFWGHINNLPDGNIVNHSNIFGKRNNPGIWEKASNEDADTEFLFANN